MQIIQKEELTIENHPNCPECKSNNTEVRVVYGACKCGCGCWSNPVCNNCGHVGYMNSEGIYWYD